MSMNIIREIGRLLCPWPLNCRRCGEATDGEHMLCIRCRRRLRSEESHIGFGGETFGISAAAHRYTDIARDMVTTLKYNDMSAIADEMAEDMINAAEAAGMTRPDIIAYVPMHKSRRRQKYFDQAEMLARLVAKHWDMRDRKTLNRVRSCAQQARIRGAEARRRNVHNAFAVSESVYGLRVLLIDDVFTTGATSTECARVLKEAGAAGIDLLVYAVAAVNNESKMV